MRITLQLIKGHTLQSIPCVVVTVESQKYFFNLYEQFQRFYKDHYVRFSKGNKIFLTQLSSDHITGLYGVILTFPEKNLSEDVQIFGPPGLSSYLESIRFLIGHRLLQFGVYDFCTKNEKILGVKSDSFLKELTTSKEYPKIFFKMNAYLAQKQKTNPQAINDAELYIKEQTYYKDEFMEIYPVLLTQENQGEQFKPSLCYILKSNKIPGKVNAEKLKANNISPKYIGKLLEKGEVEVDGVKYYAKDFREPDSPSVAILIIDCPTELHLESLLSQTRIKQFFQDNINQDEVDVKSIVHITPTSILSNPKYSKFLSHFQKSCHHIFVNEDLKDIKVDFKLEEKKEDKPKATKKGKATETQVQAPTTSTDIEKLKYRQFLLVNVLSNYFPDYFPKLSGIEPSPKYNLEDIFPAILSKSTYQKMVEIVLSPKRLEGFYPVAYPLDRVSKLINYTENEKFLKTYKKWLSKIKEPVPADDKTQLLFKNCDPELVFLGTQAMMPSTYCNTSGIYLRFWQQGDIGFLMDCGEGSYIQILQHYGVEKTREILKNLGVIYITHIHADHHLGFLQLIRERDRIFEEEKIQGNPVFLIIPYNCGAWVAKYSQAIDKLNYKVIFTQHIRIETSKTDSEEHIENAQGGVLLQERKYDEEEEEKKVDSAEGHHEHPEKEEGEEEYEYHEDPDLKQYLIEEEKKSLNNLPLFHDFLLKNLGVTRLRSVAADHCPQAYGIYIEHKDGWKFVYTGDTKPSNTMVEEVSNTTILVHESTFGEDLKDMAVEREHSTDKGAMEIGMKLQAWRTVLTHFSQRYLDVVNEQSNKEQLGEIIASYAKTSVVRAWDHFGFRFSQLENLPLLSRCIPKALKGSL